MASNHSEHPGPPTAATKTALLRRVLELSQQEALLVDLDGLAALLDEKERLIDGLQRLDEELLKHPDPVAEAEQEEQARLLASILENERLVEARMDQERQRLRNELQELEKETRLKGYLERPAARRKKVDLKQ